MTKRNLIVLIVGIIILLILVGGFSYTYFKNKNKPVAVTPTPTQPTPTITFSKEEEKNLSRLIGLPSDQIPGVYKEKVTLYKEKLKNDCLGKKENVRNFLTAFETDKTLPSLLKEMQEVTISPDRLPVKTSMEGKDTGFKIDKRVIYECLNTNKDDFQKCQSELNGLEINNFPAEDAVSNKIPWPPASPYEYLLCRAIEQRDKAICSNVTPDPSSCLIIVGQWNFMTSVYFQPDCENLCQKDKVDISSDGFTTNDCLMNCKAIKNSDIKECDNASTKNDKIYCIALTTRNSSGCQNLEPKILKVEHPNGSIVEMDQVADCQTRVLEYKSVKENDPSILKQLVDAKMNKEDIYYLGKLYFGNGSCKNLFDGFYDSYCNLKYSP